MAGGMLFRRLVSSCLLGWLVSSMFVQQVILRATGRPSSCSFEGHSAPRTPDSRTNDENTGPYNMDLTQYEDRSNAESTDLQSSGEEGRLCRPRSPTSTQRQRLTRAAKLVQGSPLLRFNTVTVGLQDCSDETGSLSEEQQPRRQQAVPSATKHEHGRDSLPHSHWPCEQ